MPSSLRLLLLLSSFFFLLAEAELQLQQPHSSTLDPPSGNKLIAKFKASGRQVYQCQHTSTQGIYEHELLLAAAELHPYTLQHQEELIHLSHHHDFPTDYYLLHYFLPQPDAAGGRPTWASFNSKVSMDVPDSTVTGLVMVNEPNEEGNIPDLLLRATSHSGSGYLSQVSYIQRLQSQGGAISNKSCTDLGHTLDVPYEADYAFWTQVTHSLPADVPPQLVPPNGHKPLLNLYGEGYQMYEFNGSDEWVLMNATATLSSSPGQQQLGAHFFLPPQLQHLDNTTNSQSSQPCWTLFFPSQSRVCTDHKPLLSLSVFPNSINWLRLQATNHTGDLSGFGSVSYVLRLSTTGGLPPPATTGTKTGQRYNSPYSAVYWFYMQEAHIA